MSDDDSGQGRGRPQKFPGEGARISHSLRLKPAVAERLRIAAQAANRTLGEEMELRINKSFDDENDLKELIDEEVAKKTYYVARESEFYRIERAYAKACYEWDLASHQKYIRQLEDAYFSVRLRYIKKIKSFLGNRLTRFLVIEEKMNENVVEKVRNDAISFDEAMSSADIRGKQLKSELESFNISYPIIMDKRYVGVIVSVIDRIKQVHAEREIEKTPSSENEESD